MEDQPRQQRWDPHRKRGVRNILVGLAVLFGIIIVVALAWPPLQSALQWYLGPPKADLSVTDRKDLVQGLASAGQALAVLFTGVVALVGLYFTRRNTDRQLAEARESTDKQLRHARESQERTQESVQETLRLTEQGQITERFTRGIEQLGSEKLQIRLGGIYALERIAGDSLAMKTSPGRDYATIMEVLTAYVRENAPRPPEPSEEVSGEERRIEPWMERKPPADIQAILAVLRRRQEDRVPEEYRVPLDLSETALLGARLAEANLNRAYFASSYLRGADLQGADLQGANFGFAVLDQANLRGADLQGAEFRTTELVFAHLQEANLRKATFLGAKLILANLGGANLSEAHIEGANLQGATLGGANLSETYFFLASESLRGAHLEGADLRGTIGLTQEHVDSAWGDEDTKLPEGLHPPAAWIRSPPEQPNGEE
jgi:uncharacterized protein YjbI with pentapeptide repeats